jgi:hypothetical protein
MTPYPPAGGARLNGFLDGLPILSRWLPGALAACQKASNAGKLVLVCYAAAAPTPGHVAIVRARVDGTAHVPLDGPDVIMAGAHNYVSTSMRHAFDNHPAAWPNNLALFAHDTPLGSLDGMTAPG